MNKLLILSIVVLLLGCEQVVSEAVKVEKIEVIVYASGELESKQTAVIAPPSIARMWQYQIKQMLPENTQVKKGEVLVSFDDKKITDRLFDKQVELDRAQKELDNKKIKEIATEQEFILAVAEKEMEFEKAKRKAEIVDNSRSENDRKKSEIDFTVAKNDLFLSQEKLNFHKKNSILNLKLAQGKVARLTVEVDDFNRDIERLKVKAPMDGMVIYKANWEGEKPAVGESVQFGQPILELAVIEHMQLKAQVAEPDSGKLVLGQKVKIILDGTQEQIFSGKVVNLGRVFRSKSAQDKKRILDTIIEFDKTNSSVMRPGMTARIEVITKVLDKALTLPLEAVKGAADSKVITLESGLEKPVEVAHIIGNKVVLAKGVKQGDIVAL
ncbi:HlyD family efflux transporter periplasmic adaptor subunit [Pseudoalteromonas sp. C2R02]|uniref:efflux RND transporter periplasmic adaptor subunit n=1 Tax=Pseudoalteromonas sp. C2R02 TaxID=2841565 RepID=UPI001C08EECB|nr:HlyD family efflux transporter periplasmic adaptor subunit [Pseudoalteromonas sp. C2R02]MBU2969099.1 HlyD family efflux transporter periplasmic adaptor subunit [Pseudoalteromonas sp. C2R02]